MPERFRHTAEAGPRNILGGRITAVPAAAADVGTAITAGQSATVAGLHSNVYIRAVFK